MEDVARAPLRISRYRRQAVVSFGSYLVSALVLVVQIPVLTHALGAEDYGAWVVSGGIAPLVMVLDLGVPYAVNRFVARERLTSPEDAKQAIGTGLIILGSIGTVIAGCAVLISGSWAGRIGVPSAEFGLKVGGIAAAFFLCARLFLSALEGSGAVAESRVLQTVSVVGFTLVAVPTVLLASSKIEWLSIVVLGQSIALTAVSALLLRRVWRGSMPIRLPRWRTAKAVLRYGVVASASGFLSAIVEPLGRFALAAVAGPASVAPLDIALRVRGQAFGAASAFLSPVMPAIAELRSPREVEDYCRPIWRALVPAAFVYGCGVAALVWAFAPQLFGSAIGDDAGPMSAVAIVLWVPSSIAMLTFLVVVVYGRARDLAYIYGPGSVIALIGTVALVPLLEAWAIILATGASAIVGTVITIHLAKRALEGASFRVGDVALATMIRAGVAGVAVLLIAALVPLPSIGKLLVGAAIWTPLSFSLLRELLRAIKEPVPGTQSERAPLSSPASESLGQHIGGARS